jgi:hypothetical protein
VLPGIEPDKDKLIWTYFEAMVPPSMPKSLIVMGSGAIGIEFASFYRTMGAEVTVVEVLPQVMPVEDAEISAHARKRFEKQGMTILTSTKVTKVEKGANAVTATVEDEKGAKRTITAERMISAVGVVGNVEGLGLEALGVTMDRGTVKTDGLGRTNVAGIYAIGDVAGPPMLAHKAEHEGVICVETIKGLHTHAMDKAMIPAAPTAIPRSPPSASPRRKPRTPVTRSRSAASPLWATARPSRSATGGPRQDDLRRQDRQAPRRPHGRRGGHRADPGLRRRHELRDDGGGADPHRLPAPDPVGNDARERARRVWPGRPYLTA